MTIEKNELFNSLTHFAGAAASVIITAMFVAVSKDMGFVLTFSVGITGISYVFLFTSSFLYHANKDSETGSGIWLKLDHCAIFIMMAGSYVGPLYIFAPEVIRWSVLAVVFACAGLGIVLKLRYLETSNWINVAIYAPLGVISLVPMAILWKKVDVIPTDMVDIPFLKSLLVAGLIMYGIGGIIYASKRPDPRPAIVGYHGIFHIIVLTGAAFHAAALYYSIKAYPIIREFLVKASTS